MKALSLEPQDSRILALLAAADGCLSLSELDQGSGLSPLAVLASLGRLLDNHLISHGPLLQTYRIAGGAEAATVRVQTPGQAREEARTERRAGPRRSVRSTRPGRGHGFVYVIECGGLYKIGWSESPRRRLDDMRTGNPFPMQLVGVIEGTRSDEAQWHDFFRDKQVHREWFQLTEREVEHVLHQSFGLAHLPSEADGAWGAPLDDEWEPC